MNTLKLNKIIGQWATTPDEGKNLEILAADDQGNEVDDAQYPLATVIADDDEVLHLEIYTGSTKVQIPVSELVKAFELASGEVYSEKWYIENIGDQFDRM